ncbi:MAG: AAA family ATPase, partial [Nitrospirota bacterium]|nr:AAA family ATPase [Nitrospirota bacterium]
TSIKVFVENINAYLLDANARGRKTVLIIEEAQNLSPDVLEQLRLLTNLETNQRKLLQIIMVGQPELKEILSRPEVRQLDQRITARYHLAPLSKKEVAAYVNHRLAVAGANNRLFPPSSMNKLFRLSGGIPRLINLLCDRALLGAYVQGQGNVDKRTLVKAAKEVFGETKVKEMPRNAFRWVLIILGIVSSAVVLAATFYNNSKLQTVTVQTSVNQKLDILQWPADKPVDQSRDMAYRALFKQWNISYQKRGNNTGCQQALDQGLSCLEGPRSLNELSRLNRPAVLKLFDDNGSEFYAALISFQGKTATVIVGGETRTVDVKEIEQRWLGDYTLLWRTPPDYQGSIYLGYHGTVVEWLEKQMAIIQGRTAQNKKNMVYDKALVQQIRKFQLKEGLVPDGIVGPQTIIHLQNAAENDEPVLAGKRENK